jgi:DNA-binding protein HU-beta
MTKQDIVIEISRKTGIEKVTVMSAVEAMMETIKANMAKDKNIYLRGFGTFEIVKRAKKTARNISKNTSLIIPEHNIPKFRPSREFVNKVKAEKH